MANDDDRLVQTCAFVLRALVPYSSPYSSTDLAFDTDMLLHKKVAIDLETLKQSLLLTETRNLTELVDEHELLIEESAQICEQRKAQEAEEA